MNYLCLIILFLVAGMDGFPLLKHRQFKEFFILCFLTMLSLFLILLRWLDYPSPLMVVDKFMSYLLKDLIPIK